MKWIKINFEWDKISVFTEFDRAETLYKLAKTTAAYARDWMWNDKENFDYVIKYVHDIFNSELVKYNL